MRTHPGILSQSVDALPVVSESGNLAVVVKQQQPCFNCCPNKSPRVSMPRQLIKRYTPDRAALKKHKYLRHLGALLHDENLWHLNRRSVSGGVAAGLFWAMIPLPSQMLAAALSAVLFRINLPISVSLVWVTNPVTIPPVFYFNYLVGTWLLGTTPEKVQFKFSLEWVAAELHAIWKPLYAGSLLSGIVLGAISYGAMRLYWRWHVLKRFRARRAKGQGSPPRMPESDRS
jgi:uncharacterized protein (DUF2062 family)